MKYEIYTSKWMHHPRGGGYSDKYKIKKEKEEIV